MPSCMATREDADPAPVRAETTSGEKDAADALRWRCPASLRDEHGPRHQSTFKRRTSGVTQTSLDNAHRQRCSLQHVTPGAAASKGSDWQCAGCGHLRS